MLNLAWIIAGVSQSTPAGTDQSAYHAGQAIAVGGIFILWAIGFVVLSLIWFMSRPKNG
jgi:hypothetical protein